MLFAVIDIVSILNVQRTKAADSINSSITVSLDSSTPGSQTITAGSAKRPLLSFKINNTYSREVNVTNISLSMTGTATPDDVTKVYLFDGINLLGSSGLGRSGSGYNFTFFGTDSPSCYPNCSPFVLIPANSSKVITVMADIASTLSANQITASLSSSLFTAERLPVTGVPVAGNTMTIINATATPSITVLSPNGGENWLVGKTYNIVWKSNGLEQVNINLLSIEPVDRITKLASEKASSGNYSWTVPEKTECLSLPCITLPEHRNHKIEVVDARYGRGSTVSKVYSDTSDAPFSITAANSSVISEQVKCVFNGSQYEQKCYAASPDNANISCSGKESCLADIKRAKGESVTWKSTCGGYAYTTMDGQNEFAEFDCATVVAAPPKPIESDIKIVDMKYNAKNIVDDKYDAILAELKQLRDTVKEQQNEIKYLKSMANDLKNISDKMKSAINDFITYGVDSNTVKLGAGERAAVINSYKFAFDKLPETEAELTDVIKIANGRFPSVVSEKGEKQAKEQFIKIYKRIADMNNINDSAAIKVMTYGLRQKAENRNLNSEKSGIKIFRNIYGYTPKTTEDWNTMQAITYSGATR